ncbi:MAG: HAMP domain-containing protein [Candidatus Binataceae bacterium]|nr:HAMP domain-containing protein [Candidatus Binataceae bacterium]
MGLRVKFAAIFLILLIVPVTVVSGIEIDRRMAVMVDDLADSGSLIINQAFEQIRSTLATRPADPAAALAQSPELRAFLFSSQAFGEGVVYARIDTPAGATIAGGTGGALTLSNTNPPTAVEPFPKLRQSILTWWPMGRTEALWRTQTYEMSRDVQLNGKPFAIIKVGLSTALIAAEVRRSVDNILAISVLVIVLSLIGGMIFGGWMLRPLIEITRGVERLAIGGNGFGSEPAVAVDVAGRDELGSLAEKFNLLSQRIRNNRNQWENERGKFFNIFRSITDAVVLLDSSGLILFCNGEAQARLGLPAGGLADGKQIRALLGSGHPLVRMLESAYSTGTEVHDIALELADGSAPTRLLISIFSLGQGPEPPGVLLIARDLRPVQELEHVFDYSGRLARLGGLISGVAHQIRNPLNAMSLELELLNLDAQKGKPVEERIRSVRDEIMRLDQVVDALMRFMRPEQLQLVNIDANELIHEIVNQLTIPASVQVQYELDTHLMAVKADRALLSEAVRNIITNAVEAMPQGGTVTISTAPVGDGMLEISVRDEGMGITAEHLERIFQLYFTTKETGTGLGLSLALRAVDLHGGTIDVRSEPDSGTAVQVRLPTEKGDVIGLTMERVED